MDIDKIVIGKIKKLMSEQKISQRELAKRAKINYENLNRLIKGGRSIVKSDVLPDVAKALGVTAEFLKSVEAPASQKTTPAAKNPVIEKLEAIDAKLDQQNQDAIKWRAFRAQFDVLGEDLLKELEHLDTVKAEIIRAALGLPLVVLVEKPRALSASQKNASPGHKKSNG